jgi:hypothetical protein
MNGAYTVKVVGVGCKEGAVQLPAKIYLNGIY